jgi:hypothetical protein
MKIGIISFFIILTLTFGYFQFGQDDSSGSARPSDSKIKHSQEKFVKEQSQNKISNVIGDNTNEPLNRSEIMLISSQVEVCERDNAEQKQIVEVDHNTLINSFETRFNIDELQHVLIFLGNQKVLNTQTMTQYYEQALLNEWDKHNPAISHYNVENNIAKFNFVKKYSELAELLYEDDLDGIKQWTVNNKVFSHEKLRVKKGANEAYLSVAELAAKSLGALSENTTNWILENINFDAKSIAHAIQADIPISLLEVIIDKTDDYNSLFQQTNGKPGNLLATALLHESDFEVIQLLASTDDLNSTSLITAPINQYINHLISKGTIEQSDIEKLELLTNQNHQLDLWPNPKTRKLELQGYKGKKIPNYITDQLKKLGVSKRIKHDWSEPDHEQLKSKERLWLREQAEKFKTNFDALKEKNKACKAIKDEQISKEPKYKNITNYKHIIKGIDTNKAKLAELKQLSPSLADVFINELITTGSKDDLLEVDDWFHLYANNDFTALLKKGDQAMPHQQSYLAAKICNKFGEQSLVETFDRNWFVQLTSSVFNQCTSITDSYQWLQEDYNSRQTRTPSKIYTAIQNIQYKDAERFLTERGLMHGFPGGRDALALLLDRMVPFRAKVSLQTFNLMEILLQNTELKNMHYRRFNRLQLKYPNYYASLALKYPNLSKVESYPVNDYISFQ